MKASFIGAARSIGNSAVHVQGEDGKNILLDCGCRVNSQERPSIPNAGNAIITHSHMDHCSFLPNYVKQANPIVYAAHPVIPLMRLLFEDTIRIAEREQLRPPFNKSDIGNAIAKCRAVSYNKIISLSNSMSFELFDAGHIPGSAQVLLRENARNLLYTGDFNFLETRMHLPAVLPKERVDTLVVESTYALRDHPKRDEMEKEFCNTITETLDESGSVLVPSFAIGRTQELLQVMFKHRLRDIPIFLDGMGKTATEIILEYPEYLKSPVDLYDAFKEVKLIEHDKRRVFQRPSVILTTAGMLEGGPVLDYLMKLNSHRNSRVLLTGFQAPGTNGRRLLEKKEVRVGKRIEKVRLETLQFDFSAHAGRSQLFEYVKKINPGKVYCVHGDEESCVKFAGELQERHGFQASAPKAGDKVDV